MKISVITVCRNSENTIAHTINSFLLQDHSDKELLVVDGNSTDATVDIVKSFKSDLIRVISEDDAGIYDAMNKGLRMFTGDAVGNLNSDDAFHDNSVLGKIAVGLSNNDAVYGDLRIVSDHIDKRVVRRWRSGPFTPGLFKTGWMPPHPTFYVRRSLAVDLKAFDLRYDISADYDFMLRALELHRPRTQYIPSMLVDFMSGGSSTKNFAAILKANLECLESRRRHLGAPLIDLALFRKPLSKLAQIRWGALRH
jgi:glycosyltransferase involved in cell wall biosynthesis